MVVWLAVVGWVCCCVVHRAVWCGVERVGLPLELRVSVWVQSRSRVQLCYHCLLGLAARVYRGCWEGGTARKLSLVLVCRLRREVVWLTVVGWGGGVVVRAGC